MISMTAVSSANSGLDKDTMTKMKKKMADSEGGKFFIDIGKSWKALILLVLTGTMLSFFFIWLMANFARCLAITAIILLLIAFFGGGALCVLAGS